MKYTLYQNGAVWNAPLEITRAQAHKIWAERKAFKLDGGREFALGFARDRGKCGYYLEWCGRTYNLILEARVS